MNIEEITNIFYKEFSGINALNKLYEISKHHRIQGSTGLVETAKFIKNYLDELGFNVSEVRFPYDGVSKFFGITVNMGWDVYDASLYMVKPKEKLLHRFLDSPTLVVAHSPSTRGRFIEGSLVYVNAGFSKDFEKIDVSGKFVLTHGRAYRAFIEAAKRNALGVIVFRKDSKIPEAVPYQGLFLTKNEVNKYMNTIALSISEKTAKELLSYLKKGENVILRAYIDSEFKVNEGIAIVAEYEGRSERHVGLVAHYCHPKPSANDNASGTATLMEAARTLKAVVGSKLEKPDLGFKFIWVPEYTGTLALFALKPEYVNNIVYVINLDMVGEAQDKTRSTFIVFRTPMSRISLLNAVVEYVTEKIVGKLKTFGGTGKLPIIRYTFEQFSPGSDHDIFNIMGISSVMINQWPDKFYHTDMDTPDKVNPEMLKIAGTISLSTLYVIASRTFYDSILDITYHWVLEYYHKMMKEATEDDLVYSIRCQELKKYMLKVFAEFTKIWPEGKEVIKKRAERVGKELTMTKARIYRRIVKTPWRKRIIRLRKRELISLRELKKKVPIRYYERMVRLFEECKELNTLLYSAMMMLWDKELRYEELIRYLTMEYGRVNEDRLREAFKILKKGGFLEIT